MAHEELTVLLIDDDSLFTDVIGKKLQREQIACVYASTGTIGIDLLHSQPHPHVILLDLAMPDMDGFEVLRQLKSDASTASIPVIVFSNDATPENEQRVRELGAVQFIEKVATTPGDVVVAVRAAAQQS